MRKTIVTNSKLTIGLNIWDRKF